MKEIININSCCFKYKNSKTDIINIKNLSIKEGETVFIYGRSGSGKSTFLNLVTGVLESSVNEITILDTKMSSLSQTQRDKFRGDNFGIIHQQLNLIPFLSARENITLAYELSKKKKERVDALNAEIDSLADSLEISKELLSYEARYLSIGEQQRVAVVRALLGSPKIIIADEPTSALDEQSKFAFLELLMKQVKKFNTSLIFVSHDKSLSSGFDRVYDFSELNCAP